MKGIGHIIVAILFTLFAYFQWNDLDYYFWIPIYLIPAVIAILYWRGIYSKNALWIVAVLFGIAIISYIPQVWDWIQEGTPSITGKMKAESPFIEFAREFFGLTICLITVLWYYRKALQK